MSKPRIQGGVARGRELETPRKGTRPSPARLRAALFDILQRWGPAPFLDLYAGSGAVGLEAASRGWDATLVDLAGGAVATMQRNARMLGLDARVVRADAVTFAAGHRHGFHVVFAAPPYPLDLPGVFGRILDAGPAEPGGLYVFQHPTRMEFEPILEGERVASEVRAYGSNAITLVEVPEG